MEYLAITAIGAEQKLLVTELIQLIARHQCNVKDSRMIVLGKQFAVAILVSGNWNTIAKLENALAAKEMKEHLAIQVRRTELPKFDDKLLPYLIQVIALDTPGLVYEIANFFVSQNIYINDLQTNPFNAIYTGTAMITLVMSISVPASINLSDLRERFMLLCDELNVDGIMEPEKR